MLQPRAVRKKTPAAPAASAAPPIPSTSSKTDNTASLSHDTASPAAPELSESQSAQTRRKTLASNIEFAFCDFALAAIYPELGKKVADSQEGWVHISNLLAIPKIASYASSQIEISQALQSTKGESVEISDDLFRVRRRKTLDPATLQRSKPEDWYPHIFYLQDIPSDANGNRWNSSSLRQQLETGFSTPISHLVLPALYEKPSKDVESDANTQDDFSGLFTATSSASLRKPPSKKGKERELQLDNFGKDLMPPGGGVFKGFAFVIFQDADKAAEIGKEWAVSDEDVLPAPDLTAKVADAAEGDEANILYAASDFLQKCKDHHMQAMPIVQFNELKLEYIKYRNAIIDLIQRSEEASNGSAWQSDSKTRYTSPEPSSFNKKRRKLDEIEKEVVEAPSESLTKERWGHEGFASLHPNAKHRQRQDEGYPRGCVVFIKRGLWTGTHTRDLRAIFNSMLEEEGRDTTELVYVDYVPGLSSCHLRFANASAASFLVTYFSRIPVIQQAQRLSPADEASEMLVRPPNGEREIAAEVMTGKAEEIYWEKVPRAFWKKGEEEEAGEKSETPIQETSTNSTQQERCQDEDAASKDNDVAMAAPEDATASDATRENHNGASGAQVKSIGEEHLNDANS